jgi:hypothetical protein
MAYTAPKESKVEQTAIDVASASDRGAYWQDTSKSIGRHDLEDKMAKLSKQFGVWRSLGSLAPLLGLAGPGGAIAGGLLGLALPNIGASQVSKRADFDSPWYGQSQRDFLEEMGTAGFESGIGNLAKSLMSPGGEKLFGSTQGDSFWDWFSLGGV